MRTLRKSEIQKKNDHELVMNTMSKNGYLEYVDAFNPFDKYKEPVRFDRFKRKYERYLLRQRDVDAQFRDLCEVYGTELKRKIIYG